MLDKTGAEAFATLARVPDLRFTLESVLWGVDSFVIHYRRQDGTASEWFLLGDDRRGIASAAHYAGPRT
jgi:hypothetical protein